MIKENLSFDEIFKGAFSLAEEENIGLGQALKRVFSDTRFFAETWVILQGDFGGLIYLTVPLKLVGDNADILQLLRFLDKNACDCLDGCSLFCYSPIVLEEEEPEILNEEDYDRYSEAGMAGDILEESVWLHIRFAQNDEVSKKVEELLDLL